MKAFRRGLFVATLAVLASAIVRMLAGRGSTPTSGGGWRQLDGPDFR